ncbi:MAG: Gfo/Idh/MocA family oxidoreductase [Acidobacteriia bacterium]|nr:Gfo/Idh/MocA family oxidoreductase [Terriglobia bacterium]
MDANRRQFLQSTAAAAFAPQLLRSANDRINLGFIGMGKMGRDNLRFALRNPDANVVAFCDVFERNLKFAADATHGKARAVRDFREILADKSIDAVCIATPDHWHAYMTVEACKAGKDVFVEKPLAVTMEECGKMLQAARKYNRVVQAGTMQRSARHFQKAVELVRNGDLGQVTFARTWYCSHSSREGIGNPPDSEIPAGLDWDLWLGPAPMRPFNANRFGVDPRDGYYSRFRYFWDYAGGMMTDWGVHLIDIVQWAFDEALPKSAAASGSKFFVQDNRDTPDTLQVTYEYPGFVAVFENRESNSQSMFSHDYGILFHGSEATLFVDRGGLRLIPENGARVTAWEMRSVNYGNAEHWSNFLDCVRTRKRPVSDIETCQRSTAACLLGNIALRSRCRVDFDAKTWTVAQPEAKKYFSREARSPWKLTV